jgi:hypothetical protein
MCLTGNIGLETLALSWHLVGKLSNRIQLNERNTKCIGKFLDCYCCNCFSERTWEQRPRSHFHNPIASVCHVTMRCKHALFYTSVFSTTCFTLSVMDGKIKQHVCIKFHVKVSKSITNTPEMIREPFGGHSLSWTEVCEWHSSFKACWVSVDDNIQGNQAPAKWQKMLRKF